MKASRRNTNSKNGIQMFIGGLHALTSTKELLEILRLQAPIHSLSIVSDPETQRSKGYAFFRTDCIDSANALLSNSYMVRGRLLQCQIKRAKKSQRYTPKRHFLKGIPPLATDEDLERAMGRFGPLRCAYIVKNRFTGERYDFGFVEFHETSSFQTALEIGSIVLYSSFVRISEYIKYPPPPLKRKEEPSSARYQYEYENEYQNEY